MKPLTDKRRAELKRLAARPDSEINLSDIPEILQLPSDAVIGKFYRPKKQSVTIRLDSDVLAWLKASGDGYQTRVNSYLRQMMTRKRAS
ncbi:MAG: BrnA antitoxin family protein [Acidobacteria bacterium]|nr:BrnA antitoxin family protein [Acidobacteriota bacterium]